MELSMNVLDLLIYMSPVLAMENTDEWSYVWVLLIVTSKIDWSQEVDDDNL